MPIKTLQYENEYGINKEKKFNSLKEIPSDMPKIELPDYMKSSDDNYQTEDQSPVKLSEAMKKLKNNNQFK